MDECKAYLEPRGIPTFPEIEQPFEVLSILYRCAQAMNRPDKNKIRNPNIELETSTMTETQNTKRYD